MVNRGEVHLVNLDPTIGSEVEKTRHEIKFEKRIKNACEEAAKRFNE